MAEFFLTLSQRAQGRPVTMTVETDDSSLNQFRCRMENADCFFTVNEVKSGKDRDGVEWRRTYPVLIARAHIVRVGIYNGPHNGGGEKASS